MRGSRWGLACCPPPWAIADRTLPDSFTTSPSSTTFSSHSTTPSSQFIHRLGEVRLSLPFYYLEENLVKDGARLQAVRLFVEPVPSHHVRPHPAASCVSGPARLHHHTQTFRAASSSTPPVFFCLNTPPYYCKTALACPVPLACSASSPHQSLSPSLIATPQSPLYVQLDSHSLPTPPCYPLDTPSFSSSSLSTFFVITTAPFFRRLGPPDYLLDFRQQMTGPLFSSSRSRLVTSRSAF
jgi:hypothetical protein